MGMTGEDEGLRVKRREDPIQCIPEIAPQGDGIGRPQARRPERIAHKQRIPDLIRPIPAMASDQIRKDFKRIVRISSGMIGWTDLHMRM